MTVSTATAAAPVFHPSTEKKPSNAQWWKIAQLLLALADTPAPENRAEASELISQLIGMGNGGESDDCPF